MSAAAGARTAPDLDGGAPPAPAPWWRRPGFWLVVVAVVHVVTPLVVLGVHWTYGLDETVYGGQLNKHVPAGYFSAPRARGSTFIAAPVTLVTSSVAAVRIWVSILSGIGLVLAFRPWLRLVRGAVVPLAAAALASLWVVGYYGIEVMPNEWVAFATLGGTGAVLRGLREGRRRHFAVAAIALIVIGLLRPSDAAFATVPLALSALLTVSAPLRRRVEAVAAVAGGAVLGVLEWVIEAETSFGGVSARIDAAQAEQGGSGLYFSLGEQAQVLRGPLLCRDRCRPDPTTLSQLWWYALAVLVLVAVVGALVRRRELSLTLTPVFVGIAVAAQYIFTVPYGAPRFLTAAYAMAAIPAILGGREIVRALPGRAVRTGAAGVLVLALVASAVEQTWIFAHNVKPFNHRTLAVGLAQTQVLRERGLTGNCSVLGATAHSLQITFGLRCTNGRRTPTQIRAELAAGRRIIWLRKRNPAIKYGGSWEQVTLPGTRLPAWVHQ